MSRAIHAILKHCSSVMENLIKGQQHKSGAF